MWFGMGPPSVSVVPSPKSQSYVVTRPSGSTELEASNPVGCPALPVCTLSAAAGAWFGVIAIDSRSGLPVLPVDHGEPVIRVSEPSECTSNPEILLDPLLLTDRRLPSWVSASDF